MGEITQREPGKRNVREVMIDNADTWRRGQKMYAHQSCITPSGWGCDATWGGLWWSEYNMIKSKSVTVVAVTKSRLTLLPKCKIYDGAGVDFVCWFLTIIVQTAATGAFDLPNHSRGSHDLADVITVTPFHSPMLQGHHTQSDGVQSGWGNVSRDLSHVTYNPIKYINTIGTHCR